MKQWQKAQVYSFSAGRLAVQGRAADRRPSVFRRIVAGVIDRLMPLPFLAFFFPEWTLVVLAYHLLCDCSPERRSVGKWLCRLRVVTGVAAEKPARWQAALRRFGVAITQSAWCLWQFIPLVLIYELGAAACALLDSQGRRPEDFIAGTRVVTEKTFRRTRQQEETNA